jgi:methyl-accepting chemotaxis protein
MFNNQKIKFRILLGYSIPLMLFVVAALVVYGNLVTFQRLTVEADRSNEAFLENKNVVLGLAKIQRATRGLLLIKNDASYEAHAEGKRQLDEAVQKLRPLIRDEKQRERFDKINATAKRLVDFDDKMVAFVENGQTDKALDIFRAGEGVKFSADLDALTEEFDQAEHAIVDQYHKEEENAMGMIIAVLLIGTALTLFLSLAVGLLITNGIARHISNALNAMSSTSTEIAATVNQHERTASQQASMVNETTATIQELGASSRQTSEQASTAAEVAQRSLDATGEGTAMVQQTIDGMGNLGLKVGMIAEQILKLGEQSAQLGNLANMVKDLSGEINMLALNAAVEAARAGEHGKGFAVVAGEIRKLANESKKSAEQSGTVISEIQKSTNATILKTEEGTKVVEEVTVYARNVEGLFQVLSEAANSSYENAQQVLLNAKQQATAIGQVVEAMNVLNSGARDTAAGIVQTKTGIEQLNMAAGNLKQIL